MSLCPALAQNSREASFEELRAEQLAQSLLSEHRFVEAISFLSRELEARPSDSPHSGLLLLLTDALLEIGNLDSAASILATAEIMAVDSLAKKAVAQRQSRLEELRRHLLPALESTDSPEHSSDTSSEAKGQEHLITNSYFETDLRQVLTDLSLESGIPIIWDNTVQGLVTFEAADRPLDGLLRSILLPAGFVFSFQN